MLAAFNQANGLPPPHCAMRQQTYVRAPRFIGLVEEFLTVLPAEHPKQTPFFFIFHLLGDWREKAAYRTGAGHERKDADEFRAVLARPTQ